MNLAKFHLWFCFIFTYCAYYTQSQKTELKLVHNVSLSLNKFALNFLHETTEQAGEAINIALSPYTVWSLLAVIAEGARGKTAQELEEGLQISSINKSEFQFGFKTLTKYFMQQVDSTQLVVSSAIFTSKQYSLKRNFQTTVKNSYGTDVMPIDFSNIVKSASDINEYVENATNKKIKQFVSPDDVNDAVILMVSTLFFKGDWKSPFPDNETKVSSFYDHNGNPTGEVMMMYQRGKFRYRFVSELKAHAVELPYGNGDKFAMVVVLPRKGVTVSSVLEKLKLYGFSRILETLDMVDLDDDSDVDVYLPRFTVSSDLNLNAILDNMGMSEMFNPREADLLGMFYHYLYITRVIQKAKIEVNEKGTEAESAAGADVGYRSPPPKFIANHSFTYFIYEKVTKGIIFAGTITNPSSLCNSCASKNTA